MDKIELFFLNRIPQLIELKGPVKVYLISKSYLSKAQTTGIILSSKLGAKRNWQSGDQSIFLSSLMFMY